MNWKQLLAVLTLVVLMFSTAMTVSTLYNISGFERVEGRIGQLESRIDRLDDKIDGLSNEVAEIKGALKANKIMANR